MDPRPGRTRARLRAALLELAASRPLDEITVMGITERAGLNRSSFYQHYDDRDALLADALGAVLEESAAPMRAAVAEGQAPGVPAELAGYLEHIAEHATLYRGILGEHGSLAASARLRGQIELLVAESVGARDAPGPGDAPLDVLSAGIAGTVLGVITAWVLRDPLPPAEVATAWLVDVLQAPARLLADERRDS